MARSPLSTHLSPERAAPRVAELDADGRTALEALVRALAAVDTGVVLTAATLDVPLDLAAAFSPHTASLADRATGLARLLVHHTLATSKAPTSQDLGEVVAELREEIARFHAAAGEEGSTEHLTDEVREATLEEIDDLLREVALEELDADLALATRVDGTPVLACKAIPPETAHVWLLSRLYPRLELLVLTDRLLALERCASRWWFSRWSGARQRTGEWHFPWTVREQEYSLVERATLALEAPVVGAICGDELLAEVPARQQRMARALAASFASVFRVRERDGRRLVLEDLTDGKRYQVHEHNPELGCRAGSLAVGRLLPFEGERYLRSPGMAFLEDGGGGLPAALVEGLATAGGMGRGIALEALLAHASAGDERLPRRLPPADSPLDAAAMLLELRVELADSGLVETVDAGSAPAAPPSQGAGDAWLGGLQADEAMSEWIRALVEQATIPVQRRERRQRNKQNRQTKGRKRRGR